MSIYPKIKLSVKSKVKIILLCFIGFMFPALAQTLPEEERSVIALFGDSIAVGFNANFRDRNGNGTTTRGCPTVFLTNLLLNSGDHPTCSATLYNSPVFDQNNDVRNIVVTNWGEGGTTTDRGVVRINSHLNQARLDHQGNQYLALIIYGTNDRNGNISSTTTGSNIGIMIDRARALGYMPVIANLVPRSDQNVVSYNSAIESVSNSKGVNVVDMYSRFNSHSGGYTTLIDEEISTLTGQVIRLHPNDEGYLVISETWFDKALKSLVPIVGKTLDENKLNIVPIISLLLEE